MPLTNTRTPAIRVHATPPSPARPRSVRSLPLRRIGLGIVVATLGAGAVRAAGPGIDRPAEAVNAAERVITSGDGLLFPIEPAPMCEVLNNFGGYSKTFGSGGHQGVDIGAQLGQEVYAVENGVLERRFDDLNSGAGYGWGLLSTTDVEYRYFHLSAFADGLDVGDAVVAGQVIGYVGDTGNATPGGWHLHFEVRPGPQPRSGAADPVDPVPLLDIPTICNIY